MIVSNSKIACFKACRRMYELKYIYGLEPVEQSQAIERGLSYHEAVEQILNGEKPDCDNPKIEAMAETFKRNFPIEKIGTVESWFNYKTKSGHTVVGRVDARTKDGIIVEHKTTSGIVDGAYLQRLELDEQIPTYMIGSGMGEVIYTVCSTPTIRQKKDETNEEFKERCEEWMSSDDKFTMLTIVKADEELKEFAEEQDAIINEMDNCKLFYRNPNHCMKWGQMCPYAPVCKHYNPNQEYIQFKRREEKDYGISES